MGFEAGDLIGAKRQRRRGDRIVQMGKLRRTDNRCGNRWLAEHPRQRNLCARHTAFGGNFRNHIDDFAISVRCFLLQALAKLIGFRAGTCRIPIAG